MVCSFCLVKPAEGYLKWYCTDCNKLKRLINLHGNRVYEILDNVLLRSEEKQKGKELLEIRKEVKSQEKKLEVNLQDSYKEYDTPENRDMLDELKKRINKI
jgi:hypothetical protein